MNEANNGNEPTFRVEATEGPKSRRIGFFHQGPDGLLTLVAGHKEFSNGTEEQIKVDVGEIPSDFLPGLERVIEVLKEIVQERSENN